MNRRWPDRGFAAIELVFVVAVLILPTAGLLMLLPTWGEAQTAAQAAAKEAATLYASADDPSAGCAAAHAAVARAGANTLHALSLTGGDGSCTGITGAWSRGSSVTATVAVEVPMLTAPGLGDIGSYQRTATSTARIDDYRSMGGGAP